MQQHMAQKMLHVASFVVVAVIMAVKVVMGSEISVVPEIRDCNGLLLLPVGASQSPGAKQAAQARRGSGPRVLFGFSLA